MTPPPRATNGRESRRRTRRAGALLALAMAAVATAGVQLVDSTGTPYGWDLDTPQPNVIAGKVTYFIDTAGTSDIVTGPTSDLAAVRAGIGNWDVGSSRIRFQEDPSRRATAKNATDRVNYIGWVGSGLDRLTLAVTFPSRSGSNVLDMDVLFNDRDFEWDTRSPGTTGVADIEAVMAHEWGHALGADHVPLRASTMYFSSTKGSTAPRSLAPDDIALVGSMYPNDTFRQTTGTVRGSVTRFGAANHRAIHVVAVSLVTNVPAASTLTNPDGTYEIRGLPQGAYRMVAAPTLPLAGAMNAFWNSGSTAFLPAVLRDTPSNPGPSASIWVQPDAVTTVPDFEVSLSTSPFEANESLGQARLIQLGDALAARLETSADEDWFAFDATAGQKVTVSILAWHIGSGANPALTLTAANGVPIASQADFRSGQIFDTRAEGPDLDARLVGVEIPSTGRYFVQVESQGATAGNDGFYVLFVTPASDAPSAALTTVAAAPLRIDADGRSTTTLTITPRKETGDEIGSGATVTLAHDGAGLAPLTASDQGDGRYTALVMAPDIPGRDRFTVSVMTTEGVAVLADAAIVVYLGPADVGNSETLIHPRRIAADGSDTALVEFLPRDSQGEALGTGRAVALRIAGTTGTIAGPAAGLGDGVYETVLTAGDAAGTATLSALVDGVEIGPLGTLQIGFDLREVVLQAGADATTFMAQNGLKNKVVAALRAVVKKVDGVTSALDQPNTKKAIGRVRTLLAKFARAEKKAGGLLPALGTTHELARAVREAAEAAIATAVIGSGKDQRALDDAEDFVVEGDAFLAIDKPTKAAARFEKAFRRVQKLQP